MMTGISVSYAQSKESKIFCPELNGTVAIERTGLNVRIFRIGEVKTFKKYDSLAVQTNYKLENTEFVKTVKAAYKKNGGRAKVRNILFDKYNLRHGGGILVYYSNSGTIDAISVMVSGFDWLDTNAYPDELLLSLFLDFRKSFVFPKRDSNAEHASATLVI